VPLYEYQCEAGHRYETRQPFGTPPEQPCERCGKPARRLLTAPPIVFKGSGWYKTDSTRSLRAGVDQLGSNDDGDGASDGDAAPSSSATKAKTPAKAKTAAKGKGKGKGAAKAADAAAPASSAGAGD
jgi:putative FmdB family regulatory protein